MKSRLDKVSILLFLIGLFSWTQVKIIGKIGISEFFMCLVAPFFVLQNWHVLRRDGTVIYFVLALLWIVGGVFSDIVSGNPMMFWARGLAFSVVTFTNSFCLYFLLRKRPLGLKWFLLGAAISSIISIFIFQSGQAGDLAADGDIDGAIDKVVGYKLFWAGLIMTWACLPIKGWYLSLPKWVSITLLGAVAAYNLYVGGRSNFLIMFVAAALIFLGGKDRVAMNRIKRLFIFFGIGLICSLVAVKYLYKYAATSGMMGEEELSKYERQTQSGTGALRMLMAGRSEFFVGLIAAKDRPILGFGSHALDYKGYRRDFLFKYGNEEDVQKYNRLLLSGRMRNGIAHIPAHSHIICFWLWHGIFGLLFWAYVLWLVFSTLRERMAVVPQYFGYLAIAIPFCFWHILFSPYGDRVGKCCMFCVFLLLKKIQRDQSRGVYLHLRS